MWLENTVYSNNLRMIIYDLLSSEGSLRAQQVCQAFNLYHRSVTDSSFERL